jgi:F-type H+-transporting ATPase subunit b
MSIDWWSLAFQAVNVLVLVWLLGHFFWQPVSAMIEKRRGTILQQLEGAQAQQARAAAALADIERTRSGFGKERDALLAQAHADAQRVHATRLKEAAAEAAAIEAAAHSALEAQRQAADEAWRDRAAQLAIDIAMRLCAPLAGPALQTIFLERLLDRLAALSAAERQMLGAHGAPLNVIGPSPLPALEMERLRQAMAGITDTPPDLVFVSDPDLVAGLELRGPHLVLHNSWRADARRIRAELADEHAG